MEVQLSVVYGLACQFTYSSCRYLLLFRGFGNLQSVGLHSRAYISKYYCRRLAVNSLYLTHRRKSLHAYCGAYGNESLPTPLQREGSPGTVSACSPSCWGRVGACFLSLLLSFLPLFNLAQFLIEVIVAHQSAFQSCYVLFKFAQFLAYYLCYLLFRLTLTNFAYGVLYLSVALAQQFLSLFLRTLQDFLTFALYFLHSLFVACYGLLHGLFVLVYSLTFRLPVAFVAHYVLQVFVALYVFAAHNLRSIVDYDLRQSYLSCYVYGEGTSGTSYLQLEQRTHLVAVVQHCTVHHTFVVFGKVLQVLVVGSYYGERLLVPELFQYALRYCATYLWLRSRSELVNKYQRILVGHTYHVLHVQQMTRVCREVIL